MTTTTSMSLTDILMETPSLSMHVGSLLNLAHVYPCVCLTQDKEHGPTSPESEMLVGGTAFADIDDEVKTRIEQLYTRITQDLGVKEDDPEFLAKASHRAIEDLYKIRAQVYIAIKNKDDLPAEATVFLYGYSSDIPFLLLRIACGGWDFGPGCLMICRTSDDMFNANFVQMRTTTVTQLDQDVTTHESAN